MSKPIRIQLSRKRGCFMPPNTVAVARPSKWGNPWKVGVDGTAEGCVEYYRQHVSGDTLLIRLKLRGKNLACFCKLDAPCHADVLLEIANK